MKKPEVMKVGPYGIYLLMAAILLFLMAFSDPPPYCPIILWVGSCMFSSGMMFGSTLLYYTVRVWEQWADSLERKPAND